MTQHTFTILCDELRPYIERQTTHLREAVSVEQRVAVTIWKLATNCEYRTLSNLFGLGISTLLLKHAKLLLKSSWISMFTFQHVMHSRK